MFVRCQSAGDLQNRDVFAGAVARMVKATAHLPASADVVQSIQGT
jgi:hypothetical protein